LVTSVIPLPFGALALGFVPRVPTLDTLDPPFRAALVIGEVGKPFAIDDPVPEAPDPVAQHLAIWLLAPLTIKWILRVGIDVLVDSCFEQSHGSRWRAVFQ
jgi:hypothetical protein